VNRLSSKRAMSASTIGRGFGYGAAATRCANLGEPIARCPELGERGWQRELVEQLS